MKDLTTEPVCAGDTSHTIPEFGRTADVTRLFGLKRGVLYGLHAEGLVKSALIRVRGSTKGVRLWVLASVRDYIRSQVNETGGPNANN